MIQKAFGKKIKKINRLRSSGYKWMSKRAWFLPSDKREIPISGLLYVLARPIE